MRDLKADCLQQMVDFRSRSRATSLSRDTDPNRVAKMREIYEIVSKKWSTFGLDRATEQTRNKQTSKQNEADPRTRFGIDNEQTKRSWFTNRALYKQTNKQTKLS